MIKLDSGQFEAIAEWISKLSRDIPFHIMGYIPVPGQPYSRPTQDQVDKAIRLCKSHLNSVKSSNLTSEDAKNLSSKNDLFRVRVLTDRITECRITNPIK